MGLPVTSVDILVTDFGDYPVPAHMAELAKLVKWRRHDRSWPDMRTKHGKEWVRLFRAFSAEKQKEYLS